MSESVPGERYWATDDVIACLADQVGRAVVATTQMRRASIGTTELATWVVAATSGKPLVEVNREERDALVVRLRHVHLPKLDDCGLIEWDPAAETVASGDHPALRDERVQRMLDADHDGLDDVLEAIKSRRRRVALSVVTEAGEVNRETLARRVAQREADQDRPGRGDVDAVLTKIHHVDLPKLRQAGLVADDGETVTAVDHPALDPAWLDLAARESPDCEWSAAVDDPDARSENFVEQRSL